MTKLIVIALLIGALGAAGWYFNRPKPVMVRTHVVDSGEVRRTVSNTRVGTVEACRRAQMSPAAPGQVAELNVSEGQAVAAEAILLEIWNEDLKAELRLKEAEASAARARASEACSTAAGAEREAERLRKLRSRQLIAEESVDTAVTEAESRRAACEAGLAATRVSAAAIAVSRQALERTRLRAPFAGVVAEIDVRLGEYVTPSPPGIATIPAVDLIDPDCVYVVAPIDEVDAPSIRAGMPACVTMDAFPDNRCQASVTRMAPYVLDLEKQARTVEVEVRFDEPETAGDLLPGYSADIEILLEAKSDVVRIPSEALLDNDAVFVVEPTTATLVLRDVTVGISNWEYTEIIDGLGSGDVIVLSIGREGVEAGALIKPESDDL